MYFNTIIKGGRYNEEREIECNTLENDEVSLVLEGNSFGGYEGDFRIPSEIFHEGKKYVVSSLNLQCKSWQLCIPDTIKSIVIDRSDTKKEYGSAENSSIYLQYSDKYFAWDHDGSLYSKGKDTLFHYHRKSFEVNLDENLQHISPGAICFEETVGKLIIPKGVKELKVNAISAGMIHEIDFQGALTKIEKGALDKIYNRSGDCTIKINGLLSDINDEGKDELKKWYNKSPYKRKVVFSNPQPNGHILDNGFIELSEVLKMDQKLNSGIDTRPICINADINKGIVRKEGDDDIDVSNVPIIIKGINTDDVSYDSYESIPITQISFTTNRAIRIFVYEQYEDVKKMIQQSYKSK
jgi:hypothetical protein